mmetsp:Transcript_93654/g.268026  ORF Transcript_93654/g.268026 Transcript_93654/m.268026 type:complete len:134 (+) Transcript_93654:982-1383(+)
MKVKLERALKRGGVDTVEELVKKTRFELKRKSLPMLEKQRISEYRESMPKRLSNEFNRRFSLAHSGSRGSDPGSDPKLVSDASLDGHLGDLPGATNLSNAGSSPARESIEMVPPLKAPSPGPPEVSPPEVRVV